ncbi:lipocalin family protein [Sinomicrobium weinanense]|uniref:Lipocalin family protein n=1 Tax=Sinomicrobium weinanense TaxID=2842200 RepID=A0A926JVS0_9FLAO|nr:lipocalin family protein [Sinomicrobium weinanense]MBC9798380.1 lipocalin family protein [Sinomicrobium weinanense]MBU3122148.1 lipocalin family protein [Sinomicrobium weinanense]
MKTVFSILLLLMMTMGCSDDSDMGDKDVSIVGKWQMTESYVSPGGETEWKEVEDGRIHHFKADSTFTSNGLECPEGRFSITGDTLLLEFNCNYEVNSRTIKFYFDDGDLFLTPIMPMCVEKCLSKYERID